jgi:hypothetical protein
VGSGVRELVAGVRPPFATVGQSATVTDLSRLRYSIGGLEQGVAYYVAVSATNDQGPGLRQAASPPFLAPLDVPPAAPQPAPAPAPALSVVDGSALRVSMAAPARLGGGALQGFRVEWDAPELRSEVQLITLNVPHRAEVQEVPLSGTDLDVLPALRGRRDNRAAALPLRRHGRPVAPRVQRCGHGAAAARPRRAARRLQGDRVDTVAQLTPGSK